MSDIREKLLRQMAALRQTIDPKVLDRAKLAMFGKVPYDQDVAKEAIARFLDARDDGGAFRRKLEQALARDGARLDLETAAGGKPETTPPKPTHPLKPRRIGRIA